MTKIDYDLIYRINWFWSQVQKKSECKVICVCIFFY